MKKLFCYFLWFIFCISIVTFSACENNATPDGHNVFTFKINGEFFRARSNDWKGKTTVATVKTDTVSIGGTNSISSYHSVSFRINNFNGPGTYILNNSLHINYGEYHRGSLIHTYTDANHIGEVIIKHYLPKDQIIAGTFSFTTIDKDTGETYQITDGTFDMTYGIFNN